MYNPTPNWRPTSSYVAPVPPPSAHPGEAPLVCLSVNQEWVKYILGCLQQLCQPTTWQVADHAALMDVLADVQDLLIRVGSAEVCSMLRWSDEACAVQESFDGGATWANISGWPAEMPPACLVGAPGADGAPGTPASNPLLRLNSATCQLEESYDDGESWTSVTGWSALAGCLIPAAPNPRDDPTAQHACNISGYLATQVVQLAMAKAVEDYNSAKSAIQFALDVMALVPGVNVIARVAAIALYGLYSVITSGNIDNFEDASTNETLLSNIICAFYLATKDDGEVTAGNFDDILTNLAAIGYAHSEVVDAIHQFVSDLGADGIRALQVVGAIAVYDCSQCGTCPPLHATTVGSGCTFVESGTGASQLTMGGSTGYVGVFRSTAIDNAVRDTLRCTIPPSGNYAALGYFAGSLAHSGPSQGDNLWVNSVNYAVVVHSGTWYFLAGGAVVTSGSGFAAGDTLEFQWDPAEGDPTHGYMIAYINGEQLHASGLISADTWLPVVWGYEAGSVISDIQLCVE